MFSEVCARPHKCATLATAVLAVILLDPGRSLASEKTVGEVVIGTAGLEPSVIMTEPEHKVVFVNRSSQIVHIQFLMPNAENEQHHIFQVPEQIWAIFHRPGLHPFVVHFREPKIPNLEGAVEVMDDPRGRPKPRSCSGVTVQGACIEQ